MIAFMRTRLRLISTDPRRLEVLDAADRDQADPDPGANCRPHAELDFKVCSGDAVRAPSRPRLSPSGRPGRACPSWPPSRNGRWRSQPPARCALTAKSSLVIPGGVKHVSPGGPFLVSSPRPGPILAERAVVQQPAPVLPLGPWRWPPGRRGYLVVKARATRRTRRGPEPAPSLRLGS